MTTPPPDYHMTPDEFRQHGYAAIDWIARYMETVGDHPVRSEVEPGAVRAQLPPLPPEHGEPFGAMLRDLDDIVLPGLTHWQSPNFFAYFPANTSGPSILAELISAGLGVQGMLWQTSPACTEVETHVLDWLIKMMDLPRVFHSSGSGGGVIQDSASSATLCALLAARERATGFISNDAGVSTTLTAYTSIHAHSSVEKAMMIAGLGRDNLRLIAADKHHAMCPDALAEAIAADRAAGHTPAFVSATVGTTSSHGIDPLPALAQICQRESLWLHVDAAHAGTAALCPEFRFIHDGLGQVDSYCFNPHKWMFTNFDCNCFYVRDRTALVRTLSVLPEYLRNAATASGAVFDYRDWQVPLGRRFRALKLWWVIRHYGAAGLRAHIAEHVALAQWFADQVRAHPDFELAAEPPLNLVCFRHRNGDEASERLLTTLNDSGALYLTHTKLDDRYVLRMSIGGTLTERRHVEAAWERITSVSGL